MVSFQRMRDDLDELGTHVSNKLPVLNRVSCLVLLAGLLFVVLLIALIVVVASGGGDTAADSADKSQWQADLSASSCPELRAERLLTTVQADTSFRGMVVDLACEGDYTPFPNQIKCMGNPQNDEKLYWSHLPVCHPTLLISSKHWQQTYHARSVSCTGNSTATECVLSCVSDYVAVEHNPYVCTSRPCPAWKLSGNESRCFMCDDKCDQLHDVDDPDSRKLLGALDCDQECTQMLVLSDKSAAVWQSKRIGLFEFVGEHNSRPVYQNAASKEYLFFTWTGSEWLVGPDFRKPHAGIQIFGNDHKFCPEMSGGANATRLYINPAADLGLTSGMWTKDDSLELRCKKADYVPIECPCNKFKVYTLNYTNNETRPAAADHLTGDKFFKKETKGLLAPSYFDESKQIWLFSHHPQGRVWQVSQKLTTTPLRGFLQADSQKVAACPDDADLTWEWFEDSGPDGRQTYRKDAHVKIKCTDGHHGA